MKAVLVSLLIVLCLIPYSTNAQTIKKPGLTLVIPERDVRGYSADRIRLGGHTEPGNTVKINGNPVRVYPTGAFVSLIQLNVGENIITVEATNRGGTTQLTRKVERTAPLVTTPSTVLAIETAMMLPSENQELQAGDLLLVQFKGNPDGNATFSIGETIQHIPMTEKPATRDTDLKGIYTGVYRIRPEDRILNLPVQFHLAVPALGQTNRASGARITVQPEQYPQVAMTTDPEAFLSVGTGQARLGGAQLGSLGQGVLLELSGRSGDLYRVQLSTSRTAWIGASQIELMPQGTPPPRSLVGSARLEGDNKADTFRIPLETRLPYTLEAWMEPPHLILNLYGATSNLTWITEHLSAEIVKRVSWEQAEDQHLRFRLDLNEPPIWGYSAGYDQDSNVLQITVRRPPRLAKPPASPLKGLSFAVDAGHGGSNVGALGALGTTEKKVNLQVSAQLSRLLQERGARVISIRTRDELVENRRRTQTAIDENADFFLSIHANSIGMSADPLRSRGTSTYFRHVPFRELSLFLYRHLLDLGLEPYGIISSFNAGVVRPSDIPTVLVETAFLSHPEDEALLIDPVFQQKIAQAIVLGLEEYLDHHRTRLNAPASGMPLLEH